MSDNFNVMEHMTLLERMLGLQNTKAVYDYPSLSLLSKEMPFLLELANGNNSLVDDVAKRFNLDSEIIRVAVIKYLEDAYLKHTDNPYRVLGLSPWSTLGDVKLRYRVLIRLFHPDRALIHYSSEIDFAANVNLAFTTISNKLNGTAIKSYQMQAYSSSNADQRGEDKLPQRDLHVEQLLVQFKLNVKKVITFFVFIFSKAKRISNFISHVFLHLLGDIKRLNFYSYYLVMLSKSKQARKQFSFLINLINFKISAIQFTFLAISAFSFSLVVFGEPEISRSFYTDVERYLTFSKFTQEQEQARIEIARKEEMRALALKEEQKRIETQRVALQKAELLRQREEKQEQARIEIARKEEMRALALKEEQKRIETQRVALQKAELLRQQEQARIEIARKEEMRGLALKEEQKRIETQRVALQKAELLREREEKQEQIVKQADPSPNVNSQASQLSVLKDDNASKAQLTLAKKNDATHQPAVKKEASSKVSNTNALNHDATMKELNLRFSTVLIDNLEVEKNDDQSLTDFRIDQR